MRIRPLPWFALLICLVGPLPVLRAQETPTRPTVILRINSLDNLIADARYLAELAGKDEQAKQAEKMLRSFGGDKGFAGIDTKKPLGLYGKVGPNGIDSEVVVLLPVVDDKTVLEQLAKFNVKATKGDDDVYEVALPGPLNFSAYFRFANGYAYATIRDKNVIAKGRLLAPDKVLEAADSTAVLLRLNLEQIPESIRNMVVGQTARGLAEAKAKKPPRESPAETQVRLALLDHVANDVKSVLTEGSEVSIRLDVDRKAGELSLQAQLKGKSGSKLAERFAELGKSQSVVAGIVRPDSAMHFLLHVILPEDLRKVLDSAVDEGVRKAIKDQPNAGDKASAGEVFKALVPTVKSGDFDVGVDLRGPSAAGQYTLVAGLKVQKGAAIEKVARDLVGKIPEAERAKIKLDTDKVGSVAIHSFLETKNFDPEFKKLFGENPIFLAMREDAIFLALGEKGLEALKDALAQKSVASPIALAELSMARLVPLLTREHPAASEAAKEAFAGGSGNDKIQVTLEGGDALKVRMSMKAQLVKFFGLLDKAKGRSK